MAFQIKRIYDEPQSSDGHRILVDRLWPRGVTKERAALEDWMKEASPSPELRRWFAHKSENFAAFSERYRFELETDPGKQEAIKKLLDLSSRGTVMLLYAAKSPEINHAIILRDYLVGLEKLRHNR